MVNISFYRDSGAAYILLWGSGSCLPSNLTSRYVTVEASIDIEPAFSKVLNVLEPKQILGLVSTDKVGVIHHYQKHSESPYLHQVNMRISMRAYLQHKIILLTHLVNWRIL